MPITLVPLGAQHLQAMCRLVTADDLSTFATNPDTYHYRAVLDEDTCVGMVGLNRAGDPQIVVATVPSQRRKGYATAAVVEMARFAFDELGLPEVFAMCQVGAPSNGVVAKAGFGFVVQQDNDCYYRLFHADWQAARSGLAAP